MNYIFYRVDNDSNDDCGYGAVNDGNNCRGNLEEKNKLHVQIHKRDIKLTGF